MRALHIIKCSELINDLAFLVSIKTTHNDIDFKSRILENDSAMEQKISEIN